MFDEDEEVFRRYFASANFKNMFTLPGSTPPPVTPPPTMPDPFGPAQQEARRKAMADAQAGGRNSTILTTTASRGAGTLAGNAYAGVKAGG